jgi:hypothetical protein
MKPADSIRAVAVLFAYYPAAKPPDETIPLWAQSIQKFELGDALEAAQILGESGKWTPALAEWIDACTQCRNDRVVHERTALPEGPAPTYYPFALFLHEHEAEALRVKALDATAFAPDRGCGVNAITSTLAEMLESEMPEVTA